VARVGRPYHAGLWQQGAGLARPRTGGYAGLKAQASEFVTEAVALLACGADLDCGPDHGFSLRPAFGPQAMLFPGAEDGH
jgi:hypothetical protein